jgi:predicted esterase YcpF (UPF0227 family)
MKTELAVLGYNVSIDVYDVQKPKGVMLIAVGFDSERKRYEAPAKQFNEQLDMAVVVMNYSGFEDSSLSLKETMPAQHFIEVITVFDWICDQYSDLPLTVFGSSYGGFLATQLTKYRIFGSLILKVPAIYPPEQFYTKWEYRENNREEYAKKMKEFRTDTVALETHPLLARASKFTGRTLMIVHDQDEVVTTQTTDAYENAFHPEIIHQPMPHSPEGVTATVWQAYYQNVIDWLKK